MTAFAFASAVLCLDLLALAAFAWEVRAAVQRDDWD